MCLPGSAGGGEREREREGSVNQFCCLFPWGEVLAAGSEQGFLGEALSAWECSRSLWTKPCPRL